MGRAAAAKRSAGGTTGGPDRDTSVLGTSARKALSGEGTATTADEAPHGEGDKGDENPEHGGKSGAKAGAAGKAGAAASASGVDAEDGGEGDGKDAGKGAAVPEQGRPADSESSVPASRSGAATAESDAERTSTFVPLRSTDAPLPPERPTSAPPVTPPKPTAEPTDAPDGTDASGAEPGSAALGETERTRQQALPDPPPLDLLAQLTNKPPPPETPLRTAVRRVKIWTPLALLLVLAFVIAQAVRPLPEPTLALTAPATHTFPGAKPAMPWPAEGQAAVTVEGLGSLGTHGARKPVPIASVAKVMTAYVILRDHPVKKGTDGKLIPVDKKAEDEAGLSAQNESTVEVKEGDKISMREAVNAIMIASANNVARLLARWDAGSEEKFVEKMNKAAKDLGMRNTTYTDPSGLRAETVSTAEDQVKLGRKAMEDPLFKETVRLPSYEDTKGDTHPNWNGLVPVGGVVGIKTGTTTKAGGNLLFAAEKEVDGNTQLIVGAVLGQYRPSILDTVLAESKKLITAAQGALSSVRVVKKGEVVGEVDDQLGGRTPLVATKDVRVVGWAGMKARLKLTDGGETPPHEAGSGDRVGWLTAGSGPGQVRVPVALGEEKTEPGFGSKLTRIL
ncbi:hypothetical protein E0L36_21240 [Streptomyces sp. AJS327]|nr:hypothetical protein [Streptomyces sp. AJS327]